MVADSNNKALSIPPHGLDALSAELMAFVMVEEESRIVYPTIRVNLITKIA